MKKVTYTNLLCYAIERLNDLANAEMERQEKAKAMGASDIVAMLQTKIDEYAETIETVKTMYEIETGRKW